MIYGTTLSQSHVPCLLPSELNKLMPQTYTYISTHLES